MCGSEMLKINAENRKKLFEGKTSSENLEILHLRTVKIFDDLILEGFIRCEIGLMLSVLLECFFDDEEN